MSSEYGAAVFSKKCNMWWLRGPVDRSYRENSDFYCEKGEGLRELCVRKTEDELRLLSVPPPHTLRHTHTQGCPWRCTRSAKGLIATEDRASPPLPLAPPHCQSHVGRWSVWLVVDRLGTATSAIGSTLAGRQVLGVGWTTDKGLDERAGLGWWGNQDTRTPGHQDIRTRMQEARRRSDNPTIMRGEDH